MHHTIQLPMKFLYNSAPDDIQDALKKPGKMQAIATAMRKIKDRRFPYSGPKDDKHDSSEYTITLRIERNKDTNRNEYHLEPAKIE